MAKKETTALTIAPPNMLTAVFKIRGTAPYVQNKFSQKALNEIAAKHRLGSAGKKGKKREPKNFEEIYENCKHVSDDGWYGIPAPAFRNAMVSACRVVGFAMTRAKLSVFVLADGFDKNDQTPLVEIKKGKPEYCEHAVRNETGVVDIRPRAMWRPGWESEVKVQFDADQFTIEDVANLLSRVGLQVGLGEGRPDSKKSCGMGWGLFEVVN